jgi:hypothetical protein
MPPKLYFQIEEFIFYKFFIYFIYPLITFFYPISIKNIENIHNQNNSCIYISRHTTHNFELLLGLFTINKYSSKTVRGLGHFLIYILCPWYLLLGVVVGSRYNAEYLIKNNEYLFIIPGGAEEMTYGSESFYNTFWISKSKKYKTGFSNLAVKYNIPVIPIHGKNVEFMVFSPIIYISNKLKLTKLFDFLHKKCSNLVLYKLLYYIKFISTVIFGSIFIIPIPTNITLIIGNPITKKNNEDLITFTKRCESELNRIINL